jgi:uncharacterized protein
MLFFDPLYLLFMIPGILASVAAQAYVRSSYSKWSQVRNSAGISGPDAAQRIMRAGGLRDVQLERTPGQLTDHYDPTSHTVRMSEGVAAKPSVAAMAIIAHELGHAQQHQEASLLIQMRSFLLPAVQFSPNLSYILILAGVFLNLTGLAWIGIGFFALSVVFVLLTLPVEFDASRRGLSMLQTAGLMQMDSDREGARQVLNAAAMTYVAAAVTALLQLLYFVSLVKRSD